MIRFAPYIPLIAMLVDCAEVGGVVYESDTSEKHSIEATSEQAVRVGLAILEGERIHLDRESLIDASGKSGGGVVLAGGDWQGGHVEEKRLLGESFSISKTYCFKKRRSSGKTI